VLHLGGPGEPAGALRDLLAERVRAVPAGGRISWVTYYFRDRDLARELVAAEQRGVDVRVLLDGLPRRRTANQRVIALLRPALGDRLRVVSRPLTSRIHAKLYLFSGPAPSALIGSFNPSGDREELEPEAIAEIGDQDRGFNLLVELGEPALAAWLFQQCDELHRASFLRLGHLFRSHAREWSGADETLWFLPRAGGSPLVARLASLSPGARVRITASHLSGPLALGALARCAARGVRVEMLAESTLRRVPLVQELRLRDAGIHVTRLSGPAADLPMHAKLMLIEDGQTREAYFGSANWSGRSLRSNFELLVRSRDAALFECLARFWERIEGYAREAPASGSLAEGRSESSPAIRVGAGSGGEDG
jgi:phosphatidylserine/phosphatidylglycerophosphate/cardiolipin synthase-like enzyme